VTNDDKDWGDDEVVEPDEVIDADDEDGAATPRTRRGMAVRTPPDKWSRWSMYAGIASLGLLILFPMPLLVLGLATAGLWFGFKANKALEEADEPAQVRKRARVGMITGGLTLLALVALYVYFGFFYDAPEKIVDFA
jgi:hypothetical protein